MLSEKSRFVTMEEGTRKLGWLWRRTGNGGGRNGEKGWGGREVSTGRKRREAKERKKEKGKNWVNGQSGGKFGGA